MKQPEQKSMPWRMVPPPADSKGDRVPLAGTAASPVAALRRRGGFALLLTITLLAFLVLLLVSLSSFTRVETQVTANTQGLVQARQNALMALNIALGQLQKYTGPDQRSTAAADIAAASTGGYLADGSPAQNTTSSNSLALPNGLLPAGATASVQTGTRWWTGVWGRAGNSYNSGVPSTLPQYAQTPSPVLLGWLVSGNENSGAVTTDSSGLIASSTYDGVSGIAPFTPGSTVSWGSLAATSPSTWTGAGYDTLTIADNNTGAAQPAVLLVGPGSTGSVNTTGSGNVTATLAADRYVVAPLVPITTASAPGLSGNATIGRYAWWVGDQGVKADYTVADPNAGKTTPATDYTSRLRLMVDSRTGAELVPGFPNYPAADNANATVELDRLLEMPQAALLDTTLTTEVLRDTFHDFAAGTHGLLTDTANGGLRQDLTYYFEQSSLPSPLTGQGIIPSTYAPNWGTEGYAPKWDWLYSFYNTNPDSSQTSPTLTCRPETATQVGISPVITQFRLFLSTDQSALGSPTQTVKNMPSGTYSLPIRCNVAFVLANPYDVAITTPSGMIITIQNSDPSGNALTIQANLYGSVPAGTVTPTFDVLRAQGSTDPYGLLDTVKFLVPAGIQIGAGQTIVLTVSGTQSVTATNSVGSPPANSIQLTQGVPSSGSYFTAQSPFTFTVPTGSPTAVTAQTTLWQNNTASLTITLCDSSAPTTSIYQQISGIIFAKNGQIQGFGGNVFGLSWAQFMGPAVRSVNWTNSKLTSALYAYGRVYQDYNIRAGVVVPPNITTLNTLWAPPPYQGGLPVQSANTYNSSQMFGYFSNNLTPGQATWAEDANSNIRTDGVAPNGVFFDFPRRSSSSASSQLPVLSLGQFEHASLTADDNNPGHTVGYQSAYAVGNSYSAPMVSRGVTVQSRANNYGPTPSGSTRYFDMAYLLNTAMWDTYFFSGIPQVASTETSLNPRYENFDDDMSDTDMHSPDAAAHLLTKGAFNINSTSVNAWIALLGGLNALHVNSDSATGGAAYPRTPWQPTNNTLTGSSYVSSGTGDSPASNTSSDAYAGYRRLTKTDIANLAAEIVKRVRARGPFVSLAQFINRSTVPASSAFNATINDADTSGNLAASVVPMGRGLSGPLQAAIDSTAANINAFQKVGGDVVSASGPGSYDDRVLFNGYTVPTLPYVYQTPANSSGVAYFADAAADYANVNWSVGLPGSAPPATPPSPGPQGRTSTGIPGWLLQGDLLQSLGPVLSARSDTFVVRAYGEVVNPVTQQVTAKAWCEATVQRLPDYVDSTTSDTTTTEPASLVSSLNKTYGRRYKIIGFRWLSPSDI